MDEIQVRKDLIAVYREAIRGAEGKRADIVQLISILGRYGIEIDDDYDVVEEDE